MTDLGKGFYRAVLHYRFMEQPDVPTALVKASHAGQVFDLDRMSFLVSRETIVPRLPPGMALWREMFFKLMLRNAVGAKTADGSRIVRMRTLRLVSLADRALAGQLMRLTIEGDAATVRLEASFESAGSALADLVGGPGPFHLGAVAVGDPGGGSDIAEELGHHVLAAAGS